MSSDELPLDKKEHCKQSVLPIFGFAIAILKHSGFSTKEIMNICKEGCDIIENMNIDNVKQAGSTIADEVTKALKKVHNTQ